ncbi:MAG: hypothetical protein J6M66_13570 [Lachnospiraceae bacterium]|nr:hypothetical protein [Lachnospiraceae bacterium]
MAVFLVDYENVSANNGLKGAEFLTATDRITIFYSQCCGRIRADNMKMIRESRCRFGIHKLLKTGKNGLDFYIASECGMLAQSGERQIVIVSNDKGFSAVVDFFRTKEAETTILPEIVTASNIENGILALHGENDKKRRTTLQKNTNMLDLGAEYEKYKACMEFRRKVEQALSGTEYEGVTESVIALIGEQERMPKKEVYTGALHCFGRERGREVYRLVKEVI